MESNHNISLRLIDFFLTTYSKKHNIQYTINNQSTNISDEYKKQLKIHTKQYFDPFRRSHRFTHQFNNDKLLNTSISQLNLFKWMLENGIIEYIKYDYQNIVNEM
ncbi:hypothetical protein Klosneuvirus_1_83 [Klosneuvirus KNV1]|uniref:Uncharacterized protein n=1 Tax=Klosneuvirus KNV1 TaxID=1977640 RepID=A0A1V0SHM0_9VIRU|nr:hypothetical protein Klosneuvirus_1_83 [Klosneuvirus KNV1]